MRFEQETAGSNNKVGLLSGVGRSSDSTKGAAVANGENSNQPRNLVAAASTRTRGQNSADESSDDVIKIVEKRIRDSNACHKGGQDDASSMTNPPSASTTTRVTTSMARESDADYLDDLTLQKVVSLRLGNNKEEDVDNDKKVTTSGSNSKSVGQGKHYSESKEEKDTKKTADEPSPSSGDPVLLQPHLIRGGGLVGCAQQQPGAYQSAPGSQLIRTLKPRYSALGRELDEICGMVQDIAAALGEVQGSSSNTDNLTMVVGDDDCDVEEGGASTTTGEERRSTLTYLSDSKKLSVATLVEDEMPSGLTLPLPVAQEFDGSSKELSQTEVARDGKKNQNKMIMGSLGTVILVSAIVLLLVFLVGTDSDNSDAMVAGAGVVPQTESPTLSAEEYVLSLLPASTVVIVAQDPELKEPQSKAFQWVLGDPNLFSYTHERLQQRYALSTFYHSTGGPNWNNQTNWLDYEHHECSWFHRNYFEDVELWMKSSAAHTFKLMYNSETYPCSQNNTGKFEHLWVYRNGLKGKLPIQELSLLTSLKSMALFANQLEITLSSELGQLTALEGIEFSSLDVDGTIPSEIGLLTNLKAILASSNRITGTLPSQYGTLSQLEYSMLSKNQLSGRLPTELGLMSSLAWLYLYGNQISGQIPSELGLVTTFEFLNMYTNQLTGPVPTEIGQLTRMNLMALSDNNLSGELPSEIGRLTNIKQGLSLNRNQLVGTIPTELGAITGITGTITGSGTYGLGLGGNRFDGPIPSQLGKLSLLERLYIEDNELSGSLPLELGNMVAMGTLKAQNNQLTGSVPAELMTKVLQALNTSNAEGGLDLDSSIAWDIRGNKMLLGSVPDLLCDVLDFDCSDQLCGCHCICSEVR